MKFREKLDKLAGDRSRAELSRKAGLPQNAISDYINKGYIPRLDTASALAKVLGTSLDWLADDSQDWPPPSVQSNSPSLLPDGDIVAEFERRLVYAALDLREALRAAEKQDWKAAVIRLAELPKGETSNEVADVLKVQKSLEGRRYQLDRFNMEREGEEFWLHAGLGLDEAQELAIAKLVKRHRELAASTDYGKFRHIAFLRSLDIPMPGSSEKIDRDRRKKDLRKRPRS
jgi:transcriptional regulator with XRE-family HTH domain